jgi:quinoprotein glucose dehydrogenase
MKACSLLLKCHIIAVLATGTITTTLAQNSTADGQWPVYGGDNSSTRFSPVDQINAANIADLEVAWVWKADSLLPIGQPGSETSPLMIDGVVYFTVEQRRIVIAVDAGTGETLWMYRMDEGERFDAAPRKIHRGVSYWSDGNGDDRILLATPGFQLVALNAHTGVPVSSFGNNGVVDMIDHLDLDFEGDILGRLGNSSPVVISHDTVMVGPAMGRLNKVNAKGDVLAFDVRSGIRKWAFHTIPRRGEFGYESWLNNSADYTGNAGVWGPFSVDDETGYVYLAVESATNDLYGGARPGNNLFSSSLVCVDIETGEMIWYQQLIHHDIWDYDNVGQPILIDLTVDGRPVKAVVSLTKQAFAYVFDRMTGEPVWPLIETPVPQTTVPGEWTSATQPIPSKPPAFDLQGFNVDDLIDFTPQLRAQAMAALASYTRGPIYTPPSIVNDTNSGTLTIPGYGGGANWQGGAADPETGYVFVGSATNPTINGLVPNTPDPGNPDDPNFSDYAQRGPAVQMPGNLRYLKPPYGRITAYNMNEGEIAWQIPNGDTPPDIRRDLEAAGITDIPPTGTGSQSGLLVTRTLLFAGEGSRGQPIFHAYDKMTGEEVWRGDIPGGAQAGLPMTYMHEGRQYVLMSVNGNAPGESGNAARIVAWALPR